MYQSFYAASTATINGCIEWAIYHWQRVWALPPTTVLSVNRNISGREKHVQGKVNATLVNMNLLIIYTLNKIYGGPHK